MVEREAGSGLGIAKETRRITGTRTGNGTGTKTDTGGYGWLKNERGTVETGSLGKGVDSWTPNAGKKWRVQGKEQRRKVSGEMPRGTHYRGQIETRDDAREGTRDIQFNSA